MEAIGIKSRLIYVPPDDLRSVWPKIISGLLAVQRRANATWLLEDIYHALKAGTATLHLTDVDGAICGFVILQPITNYDGKELHIWCVYNDSPHDVISIFVEEIARMGKAIGAKRLTFQSPRAWDKRIKPFGFEPIQTIFAREL